MLTGDSAGAQLALLTYCTNSSVTLQKHFGVEPVELSVRCIVLNHGVFYLDEAGKLPGKPLLSKYISVPGLQRMLYGKHFKRKALYRPTVNPPQYICEGTELPPILLISSKGDQVYQYQTMKLYDYLKSIHIDCMLYMEADTKADHVFNVAFPDSELGKRCNAHMISFFQRSL